jgi:PleD family two-component response regulator
MRPTIASPRAPVVLIATKQEWSSRSLESILMPRGYGVFKTYTRRGALERVQRDPPDALIIHEQLPDGDGRELCRELRARELITPSTPIVLTLPHAPVRRDALAALRAGAWECLGEPLDAEEVLAILGAFVPAKLYADRAQLEGLVDQVTGLYNLRGLTRRAHELGSHAARRRAALGCVLLAPDPPPAGEPGPDETTVLHRIAATLRSTARPSDAVGRLGPAAFAVVAADADAAQARRLAERLAGAILAAPHSGGEPSLTALRLHAGCHGVSDFHAAAIDTVELMLRATAALQKAQADPGGTWLRGYEDSDDRGAAPTTGA